MTRKAYVVEELSLELTNSCPLSCLHCSSGSEMKVLPGELTYVEHVRLIREARELGATVLSLSGGSPLNYEPGGIQSPLLSLVMEAIATYRYSKVLIYVTGHSRYGDYIFNHPDVARIAKSFPEVTWIFSLHSHKSEINDFIMNRDGAYHDILESISWLIDRGQTVELHMVPMRPNFNDIPDVLDLCDRFGIKTLSLLRFVPQTRGKVNFGLLSMDKKEFAKMQYVMNAVLEKDRNVKLRLGCPIDFRHSVGLLDAKRKPCHAGDDLILVRPTGDVHPCAAWKSLPSDSNVKRNSLREIWQNSRVFNAIRVFKDGSTYYNGQLSSKHTPGYLEVEGSCQECDMIDSCLAGCPAQRLHAYDAGDIESLYVAYSDPLCPRGNGDKFIGLGKV